MRKSKERFLSKKGWRSFLKKCKRSDKRKKRIAGEFRHAQHIREKQHQRGIFPSRRKYQQVSGYSKRPKPDWPPNLKFLASFPDLFSSNGKKYKKPDTVFVPTCFSLIDNYQESFEALHQLFDLLYKGKHRNIYVDYSQCARIDVDASICMDVMLAEYINYQNACKQRGYNVFPEEIYAANYGNENVKKILFSIGAYKNLRGISIKFRDVEALPVLINSQESPNRWGKSEIDQTKIVEYIKRCLERMGHNLPIESETELYKVLGEIMCNAEEHATMPNRYAIGFFQDVEEDNGHLGVFNFSIFNFGNTIYQTFKNPKCANKKVVEQMQALSAEYTKKGWLRKRDFEEESLWTLYALQDGVTSKEKKRGNGSIQYIENFFRLKGHSDYDKMSKLVIISGNTRIVFDGSYAIVKKLNQEENRWYKTITFNKESDISQLPDKNYVSFVPNYFPGTVISARILIKDNGLVVN